MFELIIIAFIAFLTSLVSGMLGLGGAVLLIPAYLYLPQIFGVDAIDVKLITGMTSIQVFVSALTGMMVHRKKGAVNTKIVLLMGIPILFASFVGAAASANVKPEIIIGVFAFLAIAGAALMLIKKEENSHSEFLKVNSPLAVILSVVVGFFGGMAGAPGAFILSPIMMTVLRIPTRITIGSTLGIVLLSAASASAGKLITGQVPFLFTFTAVLASIPAVIIGSMLSHQVEARTLRFVLALLITAVGLQMWYKIIF